MTSGTRLRVVFVSYEYPPQFGGGIGTYTSVMASTLAGRGHRVTVVTTPAEGATGASAGMDGSVRVIRVPAPPGRGGEPAYTVSAWHQWSDTVADVLAEITSTEPIDIIEFPDYRGEGLTYLSGAPRGGTDRPVCVVRLHTPMVVLNRYNTGRPRRPLVEAFETQSLLMADRLVSPSAALAREMRSLVTGLRDIEVVPQPADPAMLAPADPASARDRVEALYVGRLEERKGVETLIRAAPAFLDACPKARLRLVGGDLARGHAIPSMLDRLRAMLPAKYAGRVVFDGPLPREQLLERYRAARLCVFPSLFENFPNTCLEAMALGRPVIGGDNSGMTEMIEDGVSGVISRSGDAADLGAKLIDLYRRPREQRARMGAAARARILAAFHPDRVAERFEEVYRSFLPPCHRSPGRPDFDGTDASPDGDAIVLALASSAAGRINKRAGELRLDRERVDREIATLRTVADQHAAQVVRLTADLGAAQARESGLTARAADLERALTEAEARSALLAQQAAQVEAAHAQVRKTLGDSVSAAFAESAGAQEQAAAARRDADQARQETMLARQEALRASDEAEQSRSETARLRHESERSARDASAAIHAAQTDAESTRRLAVAARDELVAARAELAVAQADLAAGNDRAKTLEAEILRLRSALGRQTRVNIQSAAAVAAELAAEKRHAAGAAWARERLVQQLGAVLQRR